MGRLVYEMLASLDGDVRDPSGDYQWATPGPALHEWFNEQVATRSAEVYGRGMWEDMRRWLDPPTADLEHPEARGFAQAWQGIDKVVVSTTMASLDAPRTTLWPSLDLAPAGHETFDDGSVVLRYDVGSSS